MSNPHYGGQFGQPGNTGQFQGQIPQSSQQFQGQMPQQTGFNGQMPGQMPQAPRKKNNKATALIAAIIAAVLVIIGGGAFALTRSLSASGGFASPNALANSINSAFNSNKLTSLATALSPSELKAATTWQKDYKANGNADWSKLVSPEALTDYIGQIDLSKSTIEYTVDEKSENLSLITITKWEGEVTIKPELVDKIRQNYEKAKGEKLTANESSMLDDMKSSLSKESTFSGNILGQLDLDTLTIVSVKEDGKWYISPAMTMAEQMYPTSSIRPNYDADFTDVKEASSAEEAVSGLVDALRNGAGMGDKDFYRYLDLPERRIAAVYGGAGSGSDTNIGAGIQVHWSLTSTKVTDGAIVGFGTTSITFDGDYKVDFNNDTVTVSFPDFSSSYGSSNKNTSSQSQNLTVRFTEGLVNPERLGVFTVKDKTGWHVSFIRTAGNLNLLEATDDAVNQAVDGMSSSFGYGSDVSADEMRDMATTSKPVGAMLVIAWNFMKSLN